MITLASSSLQVGVLTFGARLHHVRTPDRDGRFADIAMGFDSDQGWRSDPTFQGATIGRFANRIAGGRFTLDGREYTVPANEGTNALHGGGQGFDQQDWSADQEQHHEHGGSVTLRRTSPDGEMGFPGNLQVAVTATVWDNLLILDHRARTDAPTPVNLTNHSYFNLSGVRGSVADHEVRIYSGAYLPVNPEYLPTGEIAPVVGTPLDFTASRPIGVRWRDPELVSTLGYDHTYVLDGSGGRWTPPAELVESGASFGDTGLTLAASVMQATSGRTLDLFTDQPGVQFYSGNMLDGTVLARGGALRQGDAFCLEPQHFPDSPNRPEFPSTVLRPGEEYRHVIAYRFDVA